LRTTVHNQNGELVLEGEQKMLVRKRPQEENV
jgi:acyl dehydratase